MKKIFLTILIGLMALCSFGQQYLGSGFVSNDDGVFINGAGLAINGDTIAHVYVDGDSLLIETKGGQTFKTIRNPISIDQVPIEIDPLYAADSAEIFTHEDTLTILATISMVNEAIETSIENITSVDSSIYSQRSDTAFYLVNSYTLVDSVIYLSEYPVGNDTTGAGTAASPWHSLDKAVYHLTDYYVSNVTIQLDTGTYHISKLAFNRLLKIQPLGFYEIKILGHKEPYLTLTGKTQNPDTLFKFNFTNTFVPGELKGMHIEGYYDLPIADNGVDWLILPENGTGNVGTAVYSLASTVILDDADHVVANAFFQYGRGGLVMDAINFETQNTLKALRLGGVNPTCKWNFAGCNIRGLNIQNNHILMNTCFIEVTKQGFQVNGYLSRIGRTVFEGDGGIGDNCFQTKEGGSVQLGNIVIQNFDGGLANQYGPTIFSDDGSGGGLMFRNVETAFRFNQGMQVHTAKWPQIILENVDYLYESYDTLAIIGAFDTTNIIGDPNISWVKNDNGQRVVPQYDYALFVKGVHDLDSITIPNLAYINEAIADHDSVLFSDTSTIALNISDVLYIMRGDTLADKAYVDSLVNPDPAVGDTIHVATTGSDVTGDGTEGDPYASAYFALTTIDRTIPTGIEVVVMIEPGVYIPNANTLKVLGEFTINGILRIRGSFASVITGVTATRDANNRFKALTTGLTSPTWNQYQDYYIVNPIDDEGYPISHNDLDTILTPNEWDDWDDFTEIDTLAVVWDCDNNIAGNNISIEGTGTVFLERINIISKTHNQRFGNQLGEDAKWSNKYITFDGRQIASTTAYQYNFAKRQTLTSCMVIADLSTQIDYVGFINIGNVDREGIITTSVVRNESETFTTGYWAALNNSADIEINSLIINNFPVGIRTYDKATINASRSLYFYDVGVAFRTYTEGSSLTISEPWLVVMDSVNYYYLSRYATGNVSYTVEDDVALYEPLVDNKAPNDVEGTWKGVGLQMNAIDTNIVWEPFNNILLKFPGDPASMALDIFGVNESLTYKGAAIDTIMPDTIPNKAYVDSKETEIAGLTGDFQLKGSDGNLAVLGDFESSDDWRFYWADIGGGDGELFIGNNVEWNDYLKWNFEDDGWFDVYHQSPDNDGNFELYMDEGEAHLTTYNSDGYGGTFHIEDGDDVHIEATGASGSNRVTLDYTGLVLQSTASSASWTDNYFITKGFADANYIGGSGTPSIGSLGDIQISDGSGAFGVADDISTGYAINFNADEFIIYEGSYDRYFQWDYNEGNFLNIADYSTSADDYYEFYIGRGYAYMETYDADYYGGGYYVDVGESTTTQLFVDDATGYNALEINALGAKIDDVTNSASWTDKYLITKGYADEVYDNYQDSIETASIYSQSKTWTSMSSSSTGQYVAAVANSTDYIYVSGDYGDTWSTVESTRTYTEIAVSSTGQYQTATVYGGTIYRSIDYGATWSSVGSSLNYAGVAVSSTGQYQTASVYDGTLYRSTNYGATWTTVGATHSYDMVVMSSTGQYQWVGEVSGSNYFYGSDDYGATWTAGTISGSWNDLSISGDGKYVTAYTQTGGRYVSDDYGVTWAVLAGYASMSKHAISTSGRYQIGMSFTGSMYVSSDYGKKYITLSLTQINAVSLCISGDGHYITSGEQGNTGIFTYYWSPGVYINDPLKVPDWDDYELIDDDVITKGYADDNYSSHWTTSGDTTVNTNEWVKSDSIFADHIQVGTGTTLIDGDGISTESLTSTGTVSASQIDGGSSLTLSADNYTYLRSASGDMTASMSTITLGSTSGSVGFNMDIGDDASNIFKAQILSGEPSLFLACTKGYEEDEEASRIDMDERSIKFTGALITPFEVETFSVTKTIDFSTSSFKTLSLTNDLTINISNLQEGVNTLWIKQDGTGRTITEGTGWGDPFDGTGVLGGTADAHYVVQFIYDGTDIKHGIVIEGE